MANAGMALLLGWVLGVALQLQQATLSNAWAYGLAVGLGLLLGALSLWWAPARWRWAVCGGCAVALAWGFTGLRAVHFSARALAPGLEGRDTWVQGRIASLPQRGADGLRFVLEVDNEVGGQGLPAVPDRLQLSWYQRGNGPQNGASLSLPRAGERWRLTVRLHQPHGASNPHGFDRERWWWEQGIGAVGYVRDGAGEPPALRLSSAPFYSIDRWRQAVSERITERVPDPRVGGVLAALVVGDQAAIERDDWALFWRQTIKLYSDSPYERGLVRFQNKQMVVLWTFASSDVDKQ